MTHSARGIPVLLRFGSLAVFLVIFLALSGVQKPPVVTAAAFYSGVSSGFGHTCAVTATGGVNCWGSNNNGQLGNGQTTQSTTPVAVTGLGGSVQKIVTGVAHSCVLLANGDIQCWGVNTFGQLGDGTDERKLVPTDVINLGGDAIDVAAGGHHSCALLESGSVKCWGWNTLGQLGNGISGLGQQSNVPVQVTGLTSGVRSITAGGHSDTGHSCAVMNNGGVKCWGNTQFGQLGEGTSFSDPKPTPQDVTALPAAAISIDAGAHHTCAITVVRKLYCWGSDQFGAIGDGPKGGLARTLPVEVEGIGGLVRSVEGGFHRTCAVLVSGALKCWGRANVGDGTSTDRSSPAQVVGLTIGQESATAGVEVACALSTAGALKCWNSSNGVNGECTNPFTERTSPVNVCGQAESINGTVRGPASQALVGAIVEVCPDAPEAGNVCRTASTNVSGSYNITGLGAGAHTVRARSTGSHPPTSQTFTIVQGEPNTLNITMRAPNGNPGAIEGESSETPDEVPIIRLHEEFTLSMNECAGGTATYTIRKAGAIIDSGPLPAVPLGSGNYRKILVANPPAFYGPVEIFMQVVCQDNSTPTLGTDLYIDPSGFVKTVEGEPIVGATVTLYRGETEDGPFDVVPDGSAIMSPSNRTNPDTTDDTGHFGWDVLTGYYFVRAEADGCHDPDDDDIEFVDTQVYDIPPPVFDIDLRLECPGPDADNDGDGYNNSVDPNPNSYCAIMRADVAGGPNGTSDGNVSILDLSAIAGNFGKTVSKTVPARFDQGDPSIPGARNGTIDILDLSVVAANFGKNVSQCP